jgi:hypothetical protein
LRALIEQTPAPNLAHAPMTQIAAALLLLHTRQDTPPRFAPAVGLPVQIPTP